MKLLLPYLSLYSNNCEPKSPVYWAFPIIRDMLRLVTLMVGKTVCNILPFFCTVYNILNIYWLYVFMYLLQIFTQLPLLIWNAILHYKHREKLKYKLQFYRVLHSSNNLSCCFLLKKQVPCLLPFCMERV